MRQSDDRPAAGAVGAATDGAAVVDEGAAVNGAAGGAVGEVEAALGLVEQGLGRLAAVDATGLPEGCVTATVRRLATLDGRVDGIQARFVAAAAAAGVPERCGASSTTNWLKQQTGRAGGQAARTSRLARSAQTAPELADAVANGQVGPDQANTIAAGLERDELDADDVAELLPAARRQSPSMFGRQARRHAGRRRQQKLRDQELVARAERDHRHWRTPDGSLRYEGQLPPAEGDLLEKAIAGFYQPDSSDVPDDQRRSHGQRCADAMAGLLEAALRAGEAGEVGGVRPHIDLITPVEAMAPLRDAEHAGVAAVSDTGTVLSAAAFRKLACDAAFRRIVIGADSRPLDVGRTTRNWPPAIRAAIAAIDGGCRGPGCDLPPHRSIVHHVHWWEAGGPTSTDNGAMLCGHHHDLIHDHGWTLTMDPATRRATWTPPHSTDVIVTNPYGPAAPGTRLLEPPADPAPHTRDQPPHNQPDTASDPDTATPSRATTPQRPRGRGDPRRPPSPGSDPPHPDPANRAPPAHPPAQHEPEPLQLDL